MNVFDVGVKSASDYAADVCGGCADDTLNRRALNRSLLVVASLYVTEKSLIVVGSLDNKIGDRVAVSVKCSGEGV